MNVPLWGHASMTVIVPVTPKPDPIPAPPTKPWDLARLFATGHTVPSPNVVTWEPIRDKRIIKALRPTASWTYLPGDGAAEGPEPSFTAILAAANWLPGDGPDAEASSQRQKFPALPEGTTIRAVEVHHLSNDGSTGPSDAAPDVFIVLHLLLTGRSLADPGVVAAYFGHPAANRDERTGYPDKETAVRPRPLLVMNQTQWGNLLAVLGFEKIGATGEPRVLRPFVISHLVPDEQTPVAPFAATSTLSHWDDTRLWAWRMTSGKRLTQAWEPGRGDDDPTRDGTWLGSTWCRATAHGLAFVATRGVHAHATTDDREGATWWRDGYDNIEHVRVAGLVHRNAVLLAILTMRQSERIQLHGEELATSIQWPDPKSLDTEQYVKEAQDTANIALALELSLLRLRNRLWFSQLPGRPEETRILQALQNAAGTPELLVDIETEQRQVTRGLDAQALRVTQLQEKRQKEEAAEQEKRAADKEKRVNNTLSALSAFVSLFFVFDLSLAITQVRQNGGWGDVRNALLAALPIAIAIAIGLWFALNSRTKDDSTGSG
jgi:hypothetical protein